MAATKLAHLSPKETPGATGVAQTQRLPAAASGVATNTATNTAASESHLRGVKTKGGAATGPRTGLGLGAGYAPP